MTKTLNLLAALALTAFMAAPAQSTLNPIDLDLWTHGAVFASETEDNETVLLGGLFALAAGEPRDNLVRINKISGQPDPLFSPQIDGPVFTIFRQQDGRILIGGNFTAINGVTRSNLARLNADGTLDSSWSAGTNGPVYAINQDGPDHLLIAGGFAQIGGQSRTGLARLAQLDGAVQSDWQTPVSGGSVLDMRPGANGEWWIGGNFTSVDGQAAARLARLDQTGALIEGFTVNSTVEDLAFDPEEGLYFCGRFSEAEGMARRSVGRIGLSGSLDSFQLDIDQNVHTCSLQGNNLLIGGQFQTINGVALSGAARIAPSGSPDTLFDARLGGVFTGTPGTDVLVWNVRQLSEDMVFAGGVFRAAGEEVRVGAAFLAATDGAALTPINIERPAEIRNAILPMDDQSTIIGGNFWRSGQTPVDNILRLLPNGTLDSNWTLSVNGEVLSIAAVEPNQLALGGFFGRVNNQERVNIALLTDPLSPQVNADWSPSINGPVLALEQDLTDDEFLLVGGSFNIVNAETNFTRSGATRLSLTGPGAPDGFDPAFNEQVNSIVQNAAGHELFLGGLFSQSQGQNRRGLAAFERSGGTWDLATSFNAQLNANVWVLKRESDGSALYLGGEFTSAFGLARQRLAKFDGTLTPWTPTTNGTPVAMALDGLGRMYIGGTFLTMSGQPRPRLAKVNTTGVGALEDFNPGITPGLVWNLSVHPGQLFVSGQFTQAQGQPRSAVAVFDIDTAAPDVDGVFQDRFETAASREPATTSQQRTAASEWATQCGLRHAILNKDGPEPWQRPPC